MKLSLAFPAKVEREILRRLRRQESRREITKRFHTKVCRIRALAARYRIKSTHLIPEQVKKRIIRSPLSARKAAVEFGVSKCSVHNIRRAALGTDRKKGRRLSPAQKLKIFRLCGEGRKQSAIARAVGCSVPTVHYQVHRRSAA